MLAAASTMLSPLLVQVVSTIGLLPVAVALLLWSRSIWEGGRLGLGIFWGFLTGVCASVGNIAVSQAIVRGGEASVITPLTAMYPLVTVMLAVLFLRERINAVQAVGMGLSLFAIVLFNGVDGASADALARGVAAPWMVYALVALVLYGVTGVLQKLSTNEVTNELSTVSFAVGTALVTGGILATQKFDWALPPVSWGLALATGLVMGLALWVSYAAYRVGSASITTALIALYPVVTVVLAILFLGESMTWLKGLAIALALLAGLTLTYQKPVSAPVEVAAHSTPNAAASDWSPDR